MHTGLIPRAASMFKAQPPARSYFCGGRSSWREHLTQEQASRLIGHFQLLQSSVGDLGARRTPVPLAGTAEQLSTSTSPIMSYNDAMHSDTFSNRDGYGQPLRAATIQEHTTRIVPDPAFRSPNLLSRVLYCPPEPPAPISVEAARVREATVFVGEKYDVVAEGD